jgi:transketolase
VTAGSLGQALSQACGIALARRLRREPGRVWVFLSDGELQEGQTWEAVAMASHHRLDSLGVIVDANGQQCDGAMPRVMTVEPIADRLRAFGAETREVDGHDVAAIAAAAESPHPDRPLVVVCRTDPCRGIDLLRERGGVKLHYVRFASREEREKYEAALAAWTEDPCRS